MGNKLRIAIVTPVFNDWEAFSLLLANIDRELAGGSVRVEVVAVDDASTEARTTIAANFGADGAVRKVDVLRLATNQGHQRAIAIGLAHVHARVACDVIIVMDSDGEDRPSDLPQLLEVHRRNPGHIVVARRSQRSERLMFRTFYVVYKQFFRFLTGRKIDFGNFCS